DTRRKLAARAPRIAQNFSRSPACFGRLKQGPAGGFACPRSPYAAPLRLSLNVHHSVVRLRFCGFYRIRANRENLMRPQPLSCPDIHELGHKGNDCLGASSFLAWLGFAKTLHTTHPHTT